MVRAEPGFSICRKPVVRKHHHVPVLHGGVMDQERIRLFLPGGGAAGDPYGN